MNGERLGPAPLIIMMTQSEKNRQAALKEKEAAAGGPCRVSVANLPFEITSASLKVTMVPSPCLIQDACVSVWVDGWVCMFPLFCHVYACVRPNECRLTYAGWGIYVQVLFEPFAEAAGNTRVKLAEVIPDPAGRGSSGTGYAHHVYAAALIFAHRNLFAFLRTGGHMLSSS
jgi:hypothetical protein